MLKNYKYEKFVILKIFIVNDIEVTKTAYIITINRKDRLNVTEMRLKQREKLILKLKNHLNKWLTNVSVTEILSEQCLLLDVRSQICVTAKLVKSV